MPLYFVWSFLAGLLRTEKMILPWMADILLLGVEEDFDTLKEKRHVIKSPFIAIP